MFLQSDSASTKWNICKAPLESLLMDQPRISGAILETIWEVLRDVNCAKTL